MRKLLWVLMIAVIAGAGMYVFSVVNAMEETTVKLQIGNPYASVNGVQKLIDPANSNVAPIIQNDRTMLPLRFIGESFGLEVDWQPFFQWATLKKDDLYITITIGENEASVWTPDYQRELEAAGWDFGEMSEGVYPLKDIPLDSPAVIIEDRTFLPVRFISEEMGLNVEWNAETREVTITGK